MDLMVVLREAMTRLKAELALAADYAASVWDAPISGRRDPHFSIAKADLTDLRRNHSESLTLRRHLAVAEYPDTIIKRI